MSVIAIVFLGVLEKARLGRWGHAMAEARGQQEESGRHDGGHVDVIVALTHFAPPALHTNRNRATSERTRALSASIWLRQEELELRSRALIRTRQEEGSSSRASRRGSSQPPLYQAPSHSASLLVAPPLMTRDAIDGGLGRRSSSRGGRPRSGLSRRKRAEAVPHRNACSKLKTRRVRGSRPRSPLRGLRTRRATASASDVTHQGSGRLQSRMLAGHGVGAEEPDTVFQTQAVMVIDQMSKGMVAILTEKENKFWRDSV